MNERKRRANALMMKYYSGMIDEGSWKTAAGDIAVFNTKYRRNIKSLVVQLEPIQSGTGDPSPDNIRPISGRTGATVTRTGRNLFNQDDSTYLNTMTRAYGLSDSMALAQINRLPAGTYTLSLKAKVTNLRGAEAIRTNLGVYLRAVSEGSSFDVNGQIPAVPVVNETYSKTVTFTITDEYSGKFTYFYVYTGKNAEVSPEVVYEGIVYDIQIETSTAATAYEPYTGTTYPVSWETEAGTVYDGYVNVVDGVLTVDKVLWTRNTATMNNNINYPGWRNSGVEELMGSGINNNFTNQILNIGKSFGVNTIGTTDVIFLSKTIYGLNQDDWITKAIDVQIIIPLATPQTYQLTPQQIQTLVGENVIWSDAGTVSVEYWS